jgi:hypothetical protein
MKLTILSLVFSLIALGGTAYLGFDRCQEGLAQALYARSRRQA